MPSERRNTIRLAQLALIGLCVAFAGCARTPSEGGSATVKAQKARLDAENLATRVAVAGDTAQVRFTPGDAKGGEAKLVPVTAKTSITPKSSPRPGSPAVVRERVASTIPYQTEADADEDAIARACDLVSQKLAQLDPPLQHKPTPAELKSAYIRKDSRTVRPPNAEEKQILTDLNITGNPVYVEYDVEVSADQVREIRSLERVWLATRALGGLFALALATFLFLRADEWTKGYLTSWLALAAVTLAGAAAAALIFI